MSGRAGGRRGFRAELDLDRVLCPGRGVVSGRTDASSSVGISTTIERLFAILSVATRYGRRQ